MSSEAWGQGWPSLGDAGLRSSSLSLPLSLFSFKEDLCQHHPVTPWIWHH